MDLHRMFRQKGWDAGKTLQALAPEANLQKTCRNNPQPELYWQLKMLKNKRDDVKGYQVLEAHCAETTQPGCPTLVSCCKRL